MIALFPGDEEENVVPRDSSSTDPVIEPEHDQLAANPPTSRRQFLGGTALTVIGLSLPLSVASDLSETTATQPSLGFCDLHRAPDSVMVQTATGDLRLDRTGTRWTNGQVVVTVTDLPGALRVQLSAPTVPIKRLHLRWRARMNGAHLILGDAWERGYGDLEWRGWIPDRVMPWYFATQNGSLTHSYGVRTGARAFCFWQVDAQGISLWADVRSGGVGVQLGERVLDICEVTCRAGRVGESAFAAVHAFCRQLCSNPRLPPHPVYGSNDWYWAYGKYSAATVLSDVQHIVELSPPTANRPFAVIDDGWQPERGKDKAGVGTWDRGNEKFPDMAGS